MDSKTNRMIDALHLVNSFVYKYERGQDLEKEMKRLYQDCVNYGFAVDED